MNDLQTVHLQLSSLITIFNTILIHIYFLAKEQQIRVHRYGFLQHPVLRKQKFYHRRTHRF